MLRFTNECYFSGQNEGNVQNGRIFFSSWSFFWSRFLDADKRLEKLITDIESGVYSSPSEVHRLGQAFYAELRQLVDSYKDSD